MEQQTETVPGSVREPQADTWELPVTITIQNVFKAGP